MIIIQLFSLIKDIQDTVIPILSLIPKITTTPAVLVRDIIRGQISKLNLHLVWIVKNSKIRFC